MTVEYGLLALAVLALLAAAGIALWTHLRSRRMLDTLDRMLDDAIRGDFQESLYDESRLSALETRMAHYLSASAVSAKNLAEEKDAIKTLIGDISHQTKTPVANILLYASLLAEEDLPPEQAAQAKQYGHSTFGQSAALAAKAGAKRLWLVHYSPMITDPEEELAQAQSLFPAAECGYDGKNITLQYEEAEE